ncbi:hypothetical protein C8B47_03700 [filamentous cyanobacterium CCP4]|nr:hypothetical protein C8B47_03700 [filamentous cyanobacterium CCP4]
MQTVKMDSVIKRAKALQRMINDGSSTEGEKENAVKLLGVLLKKNGLSLKDLINTEMIEVKFTYKHWWEKSLIIQIIGMVRDETQVHYHKARNTIYADLTMAQSQDALSLYEYYRVELKREIEVLVDAFIQANRLFPDTPSNEPSCDLDFSFLMRVRQMMKNLDTLPSPVHRQLSAPLT